MAKEVKNKVSLDASAFERGTRQVRRSIKSLERGLTVDLKTAAKAGAASILAIGAALAGIGGGIAAGVKSVIDLGGQLSDLSAQTGIAVKDLMILQRAFADNGVGADKVAPSINKMQKAISDAGQGSAGAVDALARIGLTAADLANMSPADQFNAIGNAIAKIESPADRAAAAMAIFGKSGAELLTVFGGGKLDDAASLLGEQAALMEKNANLFDRASDLLGRAGDKVQGFFVGIADQVIPVILPLLERFDKLDLASQGVRFGEAIATGLRVLIGAFQQDTIGQLVANGLQKAGAEFINAIVRGWVGILDGVYGGLVAAATTFRDVVAGGLVGAAQGFGAVLLEVIASALEMVPGLGGAAETVRGVALDLGDKAVSSMQFVGERLAAFPADIQDAFGNAMADAAEFNLFDTADLDAQRKAIIDAALAAVPAVGQAAADLLKPATPAGFNLPEAGEESAQATGAVTGGVSSLAAIGGGGGVGAIAGVESLVDQSRRQTSLLSDVRDGITEVAEAIRENAGGGTNFAVLA